MNEIRSALAAEELLMVLTRIAVILRGPTALCPIGV